MKIIYIIGIVIICIFFIVLTIFLLSSNSNFPTSKCGKDEELIGGNCVKKCKDVERRCNNTCYDPESEYCDDAKNLCSLTNYTDKYQMYNMFTKF